MADIVNLNRFRKSKKRAEKDKTAADNRAKFGRTKAEKKQADAERDQLNRALDGKELTDQSED